jgi:hypothetical protein
MMYFSVHEKGKKSIITDFEEESQGVIDFSLEHNHEMDEIRNRRKLRIMMRAVKSLRRL